MLEQLLALGVRACRVGLPGRAAPHLRSATLDAQLAVHPEWACLKAEQARLRNLLKGPQASSEERHTLRNEEKLVGRMLARLAETTQ